MKETTNPATVHDSDVKLSSVEEQAVKEFFAKVGLPTDRALTFQDVTLQENYSDIRSRSEIFHFNARLVPSLEIEIPVVSANMESVTGVNLAVAVEREGGLAFPPQTLPIGGRLDFIEKLRRADCALIDDPLTIGPDATLGEAKAAMGGFGIRSLIVVDDKRKPVGILSKRDWFYENGGRAEEKFVRDLMSKKIITAAKGIDFGSASEILKNNKIEKLPLVDDGGVLAGLLTANGLFYKFRHPRATRDENGRFVCVGSIGVGHDFTVQHLKEVEEQVARGISVLLIDTARAFSANAEEAIKNIKKAFPKLPLVVGNVSTAEGAKFLFELGADVVKVGQGPGFACRTRAVGVGVPQLTAIARCSVVAARYGKTIIADGGIKSPGDMAKALIAGARAVMLGNIFARAKESAAPTFVDDDGRPVKNYIGSSSFAAQWERLNRGDLTSIRRPEGVTQNVPVTGTVKEIIDDLLRGLSSAMAYLGARNLEELREKGKFVAQTDAGYIEGIKKG